MRLPVIIGFGGISPAGRSSFDHGFNWLVDSELPAAKRQASRIALASLMQLLDQKSLKEAKFSPELLAKMRQGTLNRKLRQSAASIVQKANYHALEPQTGELTCRLDGVDLPAELAILEKHQHQHRVRLTEKAKLALDLKRRLPVNSAGQLPDGFDPASLYPSLHHPRALQLAIYAISDAIYSLGISWQDLTSGLAADQIGVYAGSMLGNLDRNGLAGYMQAAAYGRRPSSKQLPLSMPQMVADFINAYVIDNIGHTQAAVGACATFLYNLYNASLDIQTGNRRIAVVGCADAPLIPEVIEAYNAMSALSTDKDLLKLDQLPPDAMPDYTRACRPFGDNRGFVLAESAQFFILTDLEYALKLGANIAGGVGGVFINADGYKGSISKPGPGNLFSFSAAISLAEAMLGKEVAASQTFVSAHGTGTPQNRVSESRLISAAAKLFGFDHWPVCAIKSYVGHSTGPASADQLLFMLGSFGAGLIPGINTITELAHDVTSDRLHFCLEHYHAEKPLKGGILNTKGFGGNNASAFILSPEAVLEFAQVKNTAKTIQAYRQKNDKIRQLSLDQDKLISAGKLAPIYNSGNENKFDSNSSPRIENGFLYWGNKQLKLIDTNPYV